MGETPDARLLLLTRGIRSFSDGFVSVLLASYLAGLGFSGVRIGAVATATLLGTAVATLLVGAFTDRLGRRRVLASAALLGCATGVAMATASDFVPIMIIAIVGTLNPSAGDVSVFLPVEQAMLPQTVDAGARTRLFARYNLAGSLTAAAGALFAGVPSLAERWWDIDQLDAERWMFVLYGALALANVGLYRRLSAGIEPEERSQNALLHRSRGTVFRLSALFSLDAFAGGFIVQSILALWLFERYGLSTGQAGAIFFAAGVRLWKFAAAAALAAAAAPFAYERLPTTSAGGYSRCSTRRRTRSAPATTPSSRRSRWARAGSRAKASCRAPMPNSISCPRSTPTSSSPCSRRRWASSARWR